MIDPRELAQLQQGLQTFAVKLDRLRRHVTWQQLTSSRQRNQLLAQAFSDSERELVRRAFRLTTSPGAKLFGLAALRNGLFLAKLAMNPQQAIDTLISTVNKLERQQARQLAVKRPVQRALPGQPPAAPVPRPGDLPLSQRQRLQQPRRQDPQRRR